MANTGSNHSRAAVTLNSPKFKSTRTVITVPGNIIIINTHHHHHFRAESQNAVTRPYSIPRQWRLHDAVLRRGHTPLSTSIDQVCHRFSEEKVTAVLAWCCTAVLVRVRASHSAVNSQRHFLVFVVILFSTEVMFYPESLCLFFSLTTLRRNYWSNLHENFTRDASLDNEDTVKFWKSSASESASRNFLQDSSPFQDGHFQQPSFSEQAVRHGCTFNASLNLGDE